MLTISIVLDFLEENFPDEKTVSVEDIINNIECSRRDVVSCLKILDREGYGKYVVGRRDYSTRFEAVTYFRDLKRLKQVYLSDKIDPYLPVDSSLVTHSFFISKDLKVYFNLPPDLTAVEAERLGEFIKTVVIS